MSDLLNTEGTLFWLVLAIINLILMMFTDMDTRIEFWSCLIIYYINLKATE